MILSFSLTSSLCHSVSVILLHFQPKNSSFSKSLGRETKYVSRGQVVLHVELKANALFFSAFTPQDKQPAADGAYSQCCSDAFIPKFTGHGEQIIFSL